MVKKRVFISCHYMELGGAEMSLIGLLKAFDYQNYDVDLFLQSHQGELMKYIPEDVNLLPENPVYAQVEKPIKEVFRNGFWRIAIARLRAKIVARLKSIGKNASEEIFGLRDKYVVPLLPSLDYLGEYDLAISYIGIGAIVTKKVRSKKTLIWIHTDYSTVKMGAKNSLRGWDAYDYILSISPAVSEAFLKVYPSLKSKLVEMENIMSAQFVRERSIEFDAAPEFVKFAKMPDRVTDGRNGRCLNIITIGRFCYQKNLENVPFILKEILNHLSIGRFVHTKESDNVSDKANRVSDHGITDIKWFLIGYGADEGLIREKIAEAGMEDNVFILGKKSNPYPYIKACDIYVQPSRYEGKSITVREAQILCKPVVITDYPTASSQVQNNIDGAIVPMDNVGCAKGIADFVKNNELQDCIVDYLKKHDYACSEQIQRLYKLI